MNDRDINTLDTIFGEGAHDRLEKLAGVPVEQFQDGGVRLTWPEGVVELFFTNDRRFVFANYTGLELLSRLTAIFGAWGVEFNVESMEAVAADLDSAAAFQHIGFQHDGAIMRVTPERLSAYADWKFSRAAEPKWHKSL